MRSMVPPSTNTPDVQPRPEARPLAWERVEGSNTLYLTADQQKAATNACFLLTALAKKEWKAAKEPSGLDLFLPPIDEERVNHVVLLDGGRGCRDRP